MKSVLQLSHNRLNNLRQIVSKNKVDIAKNEEYNLPVEI